MTNLAHRLVDYLIENDITSSSMRDVHIYSFEVLFGKILNYGTLLLLAYVNRNIISTLFFMLTFFSLRGRTGGYHAPRATGCYIGTLFIYFTVSKIIVKFLVQNTYTLFGTVVISSIIIFFFAPLNHPNLKLDENEIQACKNYSRWLAVLISTIIFMSIWLDIIPTFIPYIAAGIGIDAGLLILGKILKQEVQKDEEIEEETFKRCS